MNDKIIIFTDGSSRGNPGPGGFGAIVIYDGEIKEIGGREEHTTNNRMELLGVITALSSVSDDYEIIVNTDSSYVVNGITKWVYGWMKNGWRNSMKEDVVNRDLWEKLIEVSEGKKIKWNVVSGHSGIPGNERCDQIATSYADNKKSDLYNGKIFNYSIDITDLKGDGTKKKKKTNSKVPGYSYLSLVNGVFKKHKDWSSCEREVKGIKGKVKFKKAISADDERNIMKEWGVS
jgi:ribonuclease HI